MRLRTRMIALTVAAALSLGSVLLTPATTRAQDADAAKWSIEDLAWFAGHWTGTLFGGDSEEAWMAPEAGTMVGAFRLKHDGKTSVIEFLLIEETDDGITYRFKHFNPDYTTWEEDQPLTFDLIELDEHRAVFESSVQNSPKRLVYSIDDEGQLRVLVEGEEDGQTESFVAVYSRVE